MRREHFSPACRAMSAVIIMIAAMIVAGAMLSSCTSTRYVPVESVKTDSIYLTMQRRDSIYIRDSVIIRQAGDTVYVDKVRYRYRDSSVRDTVYRYLDREVPVPYPIEKKLGWWDRTMIAAGEILIPVILLFIFVVFILKRKRGAV